MGTRTWGRGAKLVRKYDYLVAVSTGKYGIDIVYVL